MWRGGALADRLIKRRERLLEGALFGKPLLEEPVDLVDVRERIVGLAVRPLLVFADLHEKLDGGVLGKDLAQSLRGLLVLLGDDGKVYFIDPLIRLGRIAEDVIEWLTGFNPAAMSREMSDPTEPL